MAPKSTTTKERVSIKPRPISGKRKKAPSPSVTSSVSSAPPKTKPVQVKIEPSASKAKAFVAVPAKTITTVSSTSSTRETSAQYRDSVLDESDDLMFRARALLDPLYEPLTRNRPPRDPTKLFSALKKIHPLLVSLTSSSLL